MWRGLAVWGSLLTLALSCRHGSVGPTPADGGGTEASTAAPVPEEARAILTAEARRRAKDVPADARASHDVATRRLAVRALARIGDPSSEPALLQALSDEDPTVTGWAAYGLGWDCKGREDAHVRALTARAVSLSTARGSSPSADGKATQGAATSDAGSATGRAAIDPDTAIARAVGRCGGALAEQTLAAWVRARGGWEARAALALGDIAGKRGQLGDDTALALLDAASDPPVDAALYPFARLEHVPDAVVPKVLAFAEAALGRPGDARAFAIRALSRSGAAGVGDLVRVVTSKDFTPSERAEAARALKGLGDAGHEGAARALGRLTPDKDPFAIAALGGDDYGILTPLIAAIGDPPPPSAEPSLRALSVLRAPGDPPAELERRLSELRCAAAAALARGAYDADVIVRCADPSSEPAERARLTALGHRPLVGDRKAAWRALTKSTHVQVQEAALELAGEHAELAEAARAALLDALGSAKPGVVTAAADVINAHPERTEVVSEREKRAALDPKAPPPVPLAAHDLDATVAQALDGALRHPWPEDLVETRAALLDAAVAVHLPSARDAAQRACRDANVTMRDRAAKALRSLGDAGAACPAPDDPIARADAGVAPALAFASPRPTRVTFTTDAGDVSITFEPELAPMAAARFVALARSGFYDGVVVHRVVPGFVVQFGDPGGDGFGGSGTLLPCETSPVPFARFDVGVALAGRDTGSSQLFVALSRVPHLDGEYARVGHAQGDWDALAQGDVVRKTKVEE